MVNARNSTLMDAGRDLPLVSIVIPAYNCEGYIAEAINSVLSQEYPKLELVVIDDGSTDRTWSVINSFPEGSFQSLSRANAGQSATLNEGWENSSGEILSYLSADDLLCPGAVSRAVNQLTANPQLGMVYGDYALIDSESRKLRTVTAPDFEYEKMLTDIVVQPGPGVFFRRDLFESIGGWNVCLKQTPDYEYWLRLGLSASVTRLPFVMAKFRIHPSSQSYNSTTIEKADEVVEVIKQYFSGQDLPPDLARFERRALAMAYMVAARFHVRAGRFRVGFHRLRAGVVAEKFILFRPRALRLIASGLIHVVRRMAGAL